MRNFFTYLPLAEEMLAWGATVTSAGHVQTPGGVDYPAREAGHPPDHLFTWEKGRTLDAWQILLIQDGQGQFESKPTGRRAVRDGSIFILFPGVWHRYMPDRRTGWTESWIEFEGPAPETLRKNGRLDPRRAVLQPGRQPELTEAMDRCHLLAQNTAIGSAEQLGTSALHLLALALTLRDEPTGAPRHIERAVQRARTLLAERCDQPLKMSNLARELGLGESHFRRVFKAHTGLSPKQYATDLRLRRVRTLLRTSAETLADIADRTGFHSAYHLSAEFKKHTGTSPSTWRRSRMLNRRL